MSEEQKKSKWGWIGARGLLIAAAIGVLLILIGNNTMLFGQAGTEKNGATETVDPMQAYAQEAEHKIAALCECVRGVSEVQVIVTLEGDFSYVYATDAKSTERDGVREEQESYVTIGSGSGEQTVLLTRRYPRVRGIGIVCRGGGDATARREILALLEAIYGIPSTQIYITEAKE